MYIKFNSKLQTNWSATKSEKWTITVPIRRFSSTNVCILAQDISTRSEKHNGSSIAQSAEAVSSKQTQLTDAQSSFQFNLFSYSFFYLPILFSPSDKTYLHA